jgi:hypothetical protein
VHERRELHCVVTGWPAARIHTVRIYNPRGEVGAAGIFSSYQSASPNCRPSPHAFLVRLGHSGNTSFAFVRQQALPGSFQAHFHSGRVSVSMAPGLCWLAHRTSLQFPAAVTATRQQVVHIGCAGSCWPARTRPVSVSIAGGLHVHAARARARGTCMHVMWPRADADVTGWPITSSSAAGADHTHAPADRCVDAPSTAGTCGRHRSRRRKRRRPESQGRRCICMYAARRRGSVRYSCSHWSHGRIEKRTQKSHTFGCSTGFFFFFTTVAARG